MKSCLHASTTRFVSRLAQHCGIDVLHSSSLFHQRCFANVEVVLTPRLLAGVRSHKDLRSLSPSTQVGPPRAYTPVYVDVSS